ncbi:MAG: hypothetical protein ACK4FW_02025 [Stenotrophomonas sp.]
MPHAPLRYSAHSPPTERWKTLFLGTRWLGPDLSFSPASQAQQAARPASLMNHSRYLTRLNEASSIRCVEKRN